MSENAPRPQGAPPAVAKGPRPRCRIEVVNPDDLLVLGVNDTWYRSFTSSSDRYPLMIEVPPEVLRDPWNLITGSYTNVALPGKNEASVAYRVLLDEVEVVSVGYKCELQAQNFTVQFKDSFHLRSKGLDRGQSSGRASSRFQDIMKFQSPGGPPKV